MSLDEVLKGIPNVNWPEQDGQYKIVQFMVGGQPYVRFWHEIEKGNHTSIVQKFAKEIKAELRKGTPGNSHAYFFKDEETHKIIGAGWCELQRKSAEFFGASADYVMMVDKGNLDSIKPIYPDRVITYNHNRLYKPKI